MALPKQIDPSLAIKLIRRLPLGRRTTLRLYNRILMHFAPRRNATTYFGVEIPCDVRDMIQATIIHFRAWEPSSSRVFEALVRPGDTVVDIGANIGYYSLLFSKLVGQNGTVVAVEALPKLAAVIAENLSRNGVSNVRIANVAVSESEGQLRLFEAPPTNIGMTTTRADRGFAKSITVRSQPLSKILTEQEIRGTSLIKIDVEGDEIAVVWNILEHIHLFPERLSLSVELDESNTSEWSRLFDELTSLGFRAYDLGEQYDWVRLMGTLVRPPQLIHRPPAVQTDVLFTRSEL